MPKGKRKSVQCSPAQNAASSVETSEQSMVLKKSVIKGYHAFQIRPSSTTPPTRLTVEPEYTNIHDTDACLVWLPPLESFQTLLHDSVTDQKRQLRLRDVAGLPICHVLRGIAGFFRTIMDKGHIEAEVTGEPTQSFPPWPAPSSEGGGVVLPCNYIIFHPDIESNFQKLSVMLDKIPEGPAMTLNKE
ncbi:uncharacterized protein LOC132752999 [Ruditapes philippinarum]|uniref:uncharacterized protein LOC132752999 n=1 Tax=Ruditapes philippinarum TaxID=129788 RepID=UPI00295B1311|nr:uncharacterized protein LOC132752999 [Ruditapes philippinarum]